MSATFQGFWHGPPLGPVRTACLRSFVAQGHRFVLYTYDEVDVPDGIVTEDASSVIPRSELFHFENPFTGRPDLGPFSDLFRFRLLHRTGGWWIDVDTVCLTPEIPEVDAAWAPENPEVHPRAVGTAHLALPAGSELTATLEARCAALSRDPLAFREVLGPRLLSEVIAELGLPLSQWGSTDTFYPIRWIEAFKLWLPEYRDEVERRTAHAVFLPVYQSLPHYLGLDVGGLAPEGSYLDDLCRRHATGTGTGRRLTADAVIDGVRRFFGDHEWAVQELQAISGRATVTALGLA
jgi:hypothetical protein